MSVLNDCAFVTSMELIDPGLGIPAVTFNTNYIVKGGNKVPALNATWALTGDMASIHVVGIQFEYAPSGLTSGTVTKNQNKGTQAWSSTDTVIMGETYTIRRRFIGAGERVFGPWSTPVNIVAGDEWVAAPGSLRIWDATGGVSRALLENRDGTVRMRARMVDQVLPGASVAVGTGSRPLAIQPFPLQITDGVPATYSQDLGQNPDLTFQYDNVVALGTGETYNFQALSPSPTGFTPSLKIATAGVPTNVTKGPTGFSSDATRQFYYALGGTPVGGNVNWRVTGNIRSVFTNPQYNPTGSPQADDGSSTQDGYMIVTLWGFNGSTWSVLSDQFIGPVYRSGGNYGDPSGTYDDAYDETFLVTIGSTITQLGVSVSYESYPASTIADLRLAFQTATSGGVRSATPAGQMTTVMVYPKNTV